MIKLIVASSYNEVIGHMGGLPWVLPKDISIFREKTTNHTVVMGRKTYESIPSKFRPLKNRDNIVLSRNNYDPGDHNVLVCGSLREAMDMYDKEKDLWIIGGESVFQEGLQYADEIHLTTVPVNIEGDAFFKFPISERLKFEITEDHNYFEDSKLLFNVTVYKRKINFF